MTSFLEQFITGGDGTQQNMKNIVWNGQSFTMGTTGDNLTATMSSVDLKMAKWTADADPNDGTVEIYEVDLNGFPVGAALSTGTITAEMAGEIVDVNNTAMKWVNVPMSAASLQANKKYALTVHQETAGGGLWVWSRDASSPSYTGGAALNSNDDSATWTEDTTKDNLFSVNGGDYAGTLCTLADAVNKAGVNASSAAIKEILVSDFVKQAEGQINATTRFDWVKEYPDISGEVKYILNKAASTIAAIDIINYDLVPAGGSQDRVTSETMINVHRETVAQTLSLLRDKQVKTFIVNDVEDA